MNILKSTLVVIVTVLSLGQTSSVNAEGMDLVQHREVEKEMTISGGWSGHREVWIGHYVGKGHRLAVIDFQGAKINSSYGVSVVGARVVDTRYYVDTGYVYAKIVFDADNQGGVGMVV